MKKMIVIATVTVSIILVFLGVYLYYAYIYTPENILREARKESEITEERYILCRLDRVTGFDWLVIQDESGEEAREFINITGANPIGELMLSYEFEMGDNVFIFYVEERIDGYSEEMGQNTVEYVVTGWDILYPVRRFAFFSPRRYIVETDVRRSARDSW